MENHKKELRESMLLCRSGLSKDEVSFLSHEIAKNVMQSEPFKNMEHICIYKAFRNEVSCDDIMKEAFIQDKHVYVPVTDVGRKEIFFYEIFPDTEWKKGAYGIFETCISNKNCLLDMAALILMPGLLFDRKKNRIGYGGGYYDKYLDNHTHHITMALCYSFQVIREVPYENHDVRPDYIVTEKEIIF